MKFKPFPELHVEAGMVGGLFRIETNSGRVIAFGHFESKEDAERFAECWNACRRLYSPIAHMEATEDYVQRLEIARREVAAQMEIFNARILSQHEDQSSSSATGTASVAA